MTEEEAKTKWCPFVRAQQFQPVHNVLAANGEPIADNPAVNRRDWNPICIGSACMAWRAETRQAVKSTGRFVEAGEATLRGSTEARPTGEGFCGLAGKP